MKLSFRAEIQIVGVNPYVLVTDEQASVLKAGWKKPMPVVVTVNGQPDPPWHINMMPKGDGTFYLYLAGVVRKASRVQVGDEVDVEVRFDESYRGGHQGLPEWFLEALDKDAYAMNGWEALSPSRQKEIARYLANLKSDEARKRNLATVLKLLGGESGHYMGRDWKDGK